MANQLSWLVTKHGRLDEGEKARIAELAEKHLNAYRIAFLMRRHPATINYAMVRMQLRVPRTDTHRTPLVMRRGNGTLVRRFTPEEDDYLNARRVAGERISAIAASWAARFGFSRTPGTLSGRLNYLGAIAESQES